MRTRAKVLALAAAAAILAGACASQPKNPARGDSGKGFRVIDAVVVERGFEPGGGNRGTGTYTMGFEGRDGEATAHFRFPVTRAQYNRYQEGARVQLVMADDQLRDIRPAK